MAILDVLQQLDAAEQTDNMKAQAASSLAGTGQQSTLDPGLSPGQPQQQQQRSPADIVNLIDANAASQEAEKANAIEADKNRGFIDRIGSDLSSGVTQMQKSLGGSMEVAAENLKAVKPSKLLSGLVYPDQPDTVAQESQLDTNLPGISRKLAEVTAQSEGKPLAQVQRENLASKLKMEDSLSGLDSIYKPIADSAAYYLEGKGGELSTYADKKLKDNKGGESVVTAGRDLWDVYSDGQLPLTAKIGATVHRMTQQAPQMAASFMLQRAGGPSLGGVASFGFMGALEAGGEFQEILDKNPGVDREKAAMVSTGYGMAAGIIEQMNLAPLFKKMPGATRKFGEKIAQEFESQPKMWRMLKDGLEQGKLESIEEVTQQLLGNAGKKFFDENQDMTEGLFESAVIAFGPGAGMGALNQAATKTKTPAGLDPGSSEAALQRNMVTAQLERANLPTRDLIAIKNGEFDKVPHALDLVQKLGITPEHIDGILQNRYQSMTDAQISLANDRDQGPLVRAASMAADQAAMTLQQERERSAKQVQDDKLAMDSLMTGYSPDAPVPTDSLGRKIWTATDKTAATVPTAADNTRFQDWENQSTATSDYLSRRFPKKVERTPEQIAAGQERETALAPAKTARQQEVDRFNESYDAMGTIPPSGGNVSKEEADSFIEKTRRELKAKQYKEWAAKHAKQAADNEKLLSDPSVPVEVLKSATKEAEDIVGADPVYSHMAEAKKRGKINLEAMKQPYDTNTTRQIGKRYPGIFSLVGTVNPDEFASEMGYSSADEMINRFSEARTKKELIAQIVKEKSGQWQQAESDQQDYFTRMAERQQGREWAGATDKGAVRPPRTVYPAPAEAVDAMENMIRRKPEAFTEDDLDHWTYTAEQQARLKKAYREATNGQRELPADQGKTTAVGGEISAIENPGGTSKNKQDTGKHDGEISAIDGGESVIRSDMGTQTDTTGAAGQPGGAQPGQSGVDVNETPIRETQTDLSSTGETQKKAWELTPEEHLLSGKEKGYDPENPDVKAISLAAHAQIVKKAVADGKDVPLHVLEKYRHNQWAKKAIERAVNNKGEYTVEQLEETLKDFQSRRSAQGAVTDDRLEKHIRDIEKLIAEAKEKAGTLTNPTAKEDLTVQDQSQPAQEEQDGQGKEQAKGQTTGTLLEDELAATSDEDLAAMMDDIFGGEGKPAAPKSPRKTSPKLPQSTPPNAQQEATENQEVQSGGTSITPPSSSPKTSAKASPKPSIQEPVKTASDIAKEGGIAALDGVKNAMAGLDKLFGGKNRLGSGLSFDEDTYAQAKPEFVKAWNNAKQVGYSLKELMQYFHDQFGKIIRPYLSRFLQDVKDGNLTTEEQVTTVNQGDTNKANPNEGGQNDNDTRGSVPTDGESIRDVNETDSTPDAKTPEGVEAEGVQGSEGKPAPRTRNTKGSRKGTKRNQKPTGLWDTVPRSPGDNAETLRPEGPGTGNDSGNGGVADRKASIPAANFRITDEVGLGEGSEGVKYKDNVAAIKLLKTLIREERRATPQEQRVLARYVGWGGLANAFRVQGTGDVKPEWADRANEIEALLSKDELDTARSSSRNAHYTSKPVVDAMWRAVQRLGFKGGNALEPSSGTGNFIGLLPEALRGATNFMAVEFDGITADIAKNLYPQAAVFHSGFEKLPLPSGALDLVIGNPPFGGKGQRLHFQYSPHLNGLSIHNQFFMAGIDALKPGGIQAMVVSRFMLDSKDATARTMIGHQAKFLGAVRLPQTAFKENARTEVVTDIVFLQKRTKEEQEEYDHIYSTTKSIPQSAREWLETGTVNDPLGGEPITANSYFVNNPNAIIGVMDRSGSQNQGNDVTVKVPPGSDIGAMIDQAVSRILPENIASPPTMKDKSQRQFDSLVTGMEVALAGNQSGQVSRGKDGNLIHTFDMETESGEVIMQTRTLSPESPWHADLEMDSDWNWYTVVDVIDAETKKPAKVIDEKGKVTTRNLKERKVYKNDSDVPSKMRLGENKFKQMGAVVDLMDLLKEQIRLESSDKSTEREVEKNRKKLAQSYEDYVGKYGPTNGPSTVNTVRSLPDQALIFSLEKSYTKSISKDKANKLGIEARKDSAEMSTILTRRAIPLYKTPEGFSAPEDALAYVLSELGTVDMSEVARLYGKSEEETIGELQDRSEPLVFKNPEIGSFESVDEYLSGNVSRKLQAAREAMADENQSEDFDVNIKSLEKVLPEPWTSDKVTVVLGATWFDPSIYADFLSSLTGDSSQVRFNKLANTFFVQGSATGPKAQQWNTQRMDASVILEHLLNRKAFRIYDQDRDGSRHLNEEESLLAKNMSDNIRQEFESWVMKDSDRREHLTALYNQKYNVRSNRQRSGQHLQMPGKVPDAIISMRRHQKNGIWRGIVDKFVLYDHAVGAGKTFTGIARAMERKRMGISRKPMIVVPNHLVEQFAADVYRLYPGANLLAMGKKDLEGKKRRRAFAKMATGDYDIIIMPHSSFEFIGIDNATETRYLQAEINIALEMLSQAEEEARDEGWDGNAKRKPLTVKKAEAMVTHLNTRMEKLRNQGRSKDRLLTFEQIGVDDLTIDEAHEYKNLFYSSNLNVKGMNDRQGSAKAYNLWAKIRTLREQQRGSVAFMTGTPISNSAVEMYILMKYLGADMLADGDIEHFDAWYPQFTTTTTEFEFDPTGGSLKETTRLGREWSNMRNLMGMYYTFADCVTNEDIQAQFAEDNPGKKFPIPDVKGGGRKAVEVPATPAQLQTIEEIVSRYENLDSIQDLNLRSAERLRLMDLAKKASLDVRAIDPRIESDEKGGKLDTIAEKVAEIYTQWNADKGTQLVFLDRGIPKGKGDAKEIKKYDDLVAELEAAMNSGDEDKARSLNGKLEKFDRNEIEEMRSAQFTNWSAYQQLKDNLIARGIPEKEIRFVQDANTDLQKAELFEEVNAGTVRVLIGSTKKMGAGTNVQQRLVALHHGDVTYKPSDIEQREGRIIRQGNLFNTVPTEADPNPLYRQDFQVVINAYVTTRTVDAMLWDLNSQKMKMINGIRKYQGEFNMEFDDDEAVSMKQIAALASGDPLQLERVKLISEIQKLIRLESAHQRGVWGAQDAATKSQRKIDELPAKILFTKAARATLEKGQEEIDKNVVARKVTIGDRSFTHATKKEALQELDDAKKLRDETKGKFSLTIDGVEYKSADKAENAIQEALGDDNPFLATFSGHGQDFIRRVNMYREIANLANEKIGPAMLKQAGSKLPRMKEEKLGSFFYRGMEFELSVEVESEEARVKFGRAGGGGVKTSAIFTLVGKLEGKRFATYHSQDITQTDVERAIPNNPPSVRVTLSGMFREPDIEIDGIVKYGPTPEQMAQSLEREKENLPEHERKASEPFAKKEELDEKTARLNEVERSLAAQAPQRNASSRAAQTSMATSVPESNRANVEGELEQGLGSKVRVRRLLNSVGIIETQEEAKGLVSRNAAVKYSENGAIQGIYINGKAHLVRDGIAKGQVMPVLLHELGEHAKQLGFSKNSEYQAILTSLKKRQGMQNRIGEVIRKALAAVPKNTAAEHQWSEVAAYLVEHHANDNIGLVDRIVNFFKKWLFKVGGISADAFNEKDLVLFARAAVNAEVGNIGGGPGGTSYPMFSKSEGQTETSAFKRWFQKSLITKNGQPLVLFHGTKDPHFLKTKETPWIFDQTKEHRGDSSALAGLGIFLGGSTIAEAHAGGTDGTVHPFYVKIERPLVIDSASLEKKVEASGAQAFRKRMEDLNGHDGIIIVDRGHVVVFNANQVKSAIDNNGEFSPANNDVRYSMSSAEDIIGKEKADIIRTMAKEGGFKEALETEYFKAMAREGEDVVNTDDAPMATKAWDWFKSLPKASARKALGALTLRQLRDVFAKKFPQMEQFYQATRLMDSDAKKIMTRADEVYNKWVALPKKAARDMSELMIKATVGGVNPDVAEFEPRANTKALKKAMEANAARIVEIKDEMKGTGDIEKLTAEKNRLEQKIKEHADKIENEIKRFGQHNELAPRYRALSQEAKDVYQAVKKQYIDNLNDLFSALEERINRQIADPKLRKQTLDAIRVKYDRYLENGPYFPLSRFGEYLTIAEKEGRREVRTFDSMAERTRYIHRRRRDGWDVQAKTKREFNRETAGASQPFVEGIFEILENAKGIPGSQLELLKDQINQHFIKALPDLSHRKHFVHRQNVEGYSRDQMRAFADNMQHAAHHIARIRHADKMDSTVASLLQESKMLKKNEENDDVTDLYNELNARMKIYNNPDISPVTQAITAGGFLWNIGPSIASALVNLTQTPLVAFPILATRFKKTGSISASRALMKASADYFTSKPRLDSGPSLIDNAKLPQHERDMIARLIDDGTIDVTGAHSLAQAAGNDFLNLAKSKHGSTALKVMRAVSWPFHVAELANRKITALAAYRLAIENGMSIEDAINETREVVLESHFDYSQANRARWMEGNVRRVLFLFKQYSQQMTWLLARSLQQAVKGESPEVKKAAAQRLGMILGGHFLVAGMNGMPVLGSVMAVAQFLLSAFGDDDEPKDIAVELRNFLADKTSVGFAEALSRGPWRAIPGLGELDISSRVSLGDLWLRAPEREAEGKDKFNQYLNLLLGPVATNASNIFMGLSSMADDGDVWRGVEMMMPKFVKDGMKAVRYSRDGVKNWQEDTLIDNLNTMEIFGQALGFTPTNVSEMYSGANAIKNHETEVNHRRQKLLNRWAQATIKGDSATAENAMSEINQFNEKQPLFAITNKGMKSSLEGRLKAREQTKAGVYVPATKEDLRSIGRFASFH
jgi:N12 class adenine-specific DNA methylase